jgi:hypothetical protein
MAVFDLFNCSLIGSGILHFLAYAREHLLRDDARYLPMSGTIRAQVIEYRLDQIWGIDVNLLNPFRFLPGVINADAKRMAWQALCDPLDVFSFDFSKAQPSPDQRNFEPSAIAEGTAGAMLFWFDLQLDNDLRLSNDPRTRHDLHWQHGLQFMPEVHVNPGMKLPIVAMHDGSNLSFKWQSDAIPKEAISSLPLVDPHSWRDALVLEQQTRDLMQHCMQHQEEYAKVAQLIKHLAIDPARHNIAPLVAERFAATFFSL